MKLYAVWQPNGDEETSYWDYIWADTPEDAWEFYVRRWKGQCDHAATDEEFMAQMTSEEKETTHKPAEEYPHSEARMEVLRDIGCCELGEPICECCGLYAMGIPEYEVCQECNNCRDCGCEVNCCGGVGW